MKTGFTHESTSMKSFEWYTPPYIFDWLNTHFDLDPCHPLIRLPWIPAKDVMTINDDSLTKDWYGNVWLNPPYGKLTYPFLEKMHKHRNGIALVFARTDCKWFHDFVAKSDAILFLRGRIRFVDGNGEINGPGPGCGSMLVAWGKEDVDALRKISDKGHFVENIQNAFQ